MSQSVTNEIKLISPGTDDVYLTADVTTVGTYDSVATLTPAAAADEYVLQTEIDDDDLVLNLTTTPFNGTVGDLMIIEQEPVRITNAGSANGGTQENVNVERGICNSISEAHSIGAAIKLVNVEYTHVFSLADERRVVRYKAASIGGNPAGMMLVIPSHRTNEQHTVVWGVLESNGVPAENITVTLAQTDNDNYTVRGQTLLAQIQTTTSSSEGYFEFQVPNDDYRRGTFNYTLAIAPGTSVAKTYTITSVPNVDHINYLKLVV